MCVRDAWIYILRTLSWRVTCFRAYDQAVQRSGEGLDDVCHVPLELGEVRIRSESLASV